MSGEGECHTVPSPLAGEGQGEGYNKHCACFKSEAEQEELAPPSIELRHRFRIALGTLSPPLPLSLPHKGGGNDVAPLRPTAASKSLHCLFLAVISVIADMVSFESGSSIGSPRAAERSAAR